MAGMRTILGVSNGTMSTGSGWLGFQTAAAGSRGSIINISRFTVSQNATTTLAMVRGALSKRDTGGTYTMTSTTPASNPMGGSASGLSGNTNIIGATARSGSISTADSGGSYTDMQEYEDFANLNGWMVKYDPDEEVVIPPSTVCILRALAAPGTLTGWTAKMYLKENG